jgi:hypothetical protein
LWHSVPKSEETQIHKPSPGPVNRAWHAGDMQGLDECRAGKSASRLARRQKWEMVGTLYVARPTSLESFAFAHRNWIFVHDLF